MSLRLIHNLFYVDLDFYEENTCTIEECLEKAIPIILSLKKQFENQINDELELTVDELKAL